MANINKLITKRKFLKARDSNLPNAFTKWYWRWFVQGKHWKNRTWVWWTLISMVGLGFILINFPSIQVISSLLFAPLMIFVLMGFVAVPMNNHRIGKIREELGVTLFEYKILNELYGDQSI